jgi:phospholipid/cholesterol/gamma-HCH transport system permease protein
MTRAVGDALASFGEVLVLGFKALRAMPRRPLEVRQLLRQIYLQGNRAAFLLVLMAGFSGLVMAYQFGIGLERFGALAYMGQLTALALTREMIPVLSALVLGGRIVAGIAAELGSMVATEQIDAVRALGADPLKKLVMPRIVAATLVLPAFCVLGDLIGLLTATFVARVEFNVPAFAFLLSVRDSLTLGDFASGVFKAALFGLLGSIIACRAGLAARGGTAGVGRATTAAVVQASLTVVIADFVVTRLTRPWLD